MKILNFKSNIIQRTLAVIFAVSSLFLMNSCEKNIFEQIAVEKTLINQLEIQTTANLPILLGKDSLLNIVFGPDTASNKNLVWSSNDTTIVKVTKEGKVSGIALGNATVTVTSTDGSRKISSINVQVIDRINYITALNITGSATSIYEAESLNLTATITPSNATYNTLKWTSSNNQVATVSSTGLVQGLSKGNVTITVASTDGSGVKQTFALVIKEVIPITKIVITTTFSETLAIGEEVAPLNVVLTPSNAVFLSLLWSTDNAAIATVTNGVIKAVGVGRATITATARNDANVKASISVEVEAGKINDTFVLGSNWRVPTTYSSGLINNGLFNVLMGVQSVGPPIKYRADFQRVGGVSVHAGTYPIIAFKFNRPVGTGNVVFDTNNGSFLNGNNKLTTITGKDGVQVHYADVSVGTFGATAIKWSTTQATTLTTFQLKIADFVQATGDNHYEVYWVKSFKSLTDLQTYINK